MSELGHIIVRIVSYRKLQTSKAPLNSQAQGTSLFTSALKSQNIGA